MNKQQYSIVTSGVHLIPRGCCDIAMDSYHLELPRGRANHQHTRHSRVELDNTRPDEKHAMIRLDTSRATERATLHKMAVGSQGTNGVAHRTHSPDNIHASDGWSHAVQQRCGPHHLIWCAATMRALVDPTCSDKTLAAVDPSDHPTETHQVDQPTPSVNARMHWPNTTPRFREMPYRCALIRFSTLIVLASSIETCETSE